MGLLKPETGLLIWMIIAFGVVFIVVARYGFPVILRAIESRKKFIDSSLEAAHVAEKQVAEAGTKIEQMIADAERQRAQMLRDVEETRKQLLEAAHKAADIESERLMAEARSRAEAERQEILRDARQQVALLAIAVSEKMLRSQLSDSAAQALLDGRLIDEMQEQQQNKRK